MKGCSRPGMPVYLSLNDNPKRRLRYTWEMIEMPRSLVCVNTQVTNKLVKRALSAGAVPGLWGYDAIRSEVNTGRGSRIDLVLDRSGQPSCFVEVKSCTLVEGTTACFPDARTARGLKHLKELQEEVSLGNRAAMFFLIQRMDSTTFKPADHIDPAYGMELREANRNGVEIYCYDSAITPEYMDIHCSVTIEL
jgi:sugar fermentation stimulation protein A